MGETTNAVLDQLRSLAAVLACVRGRLIELSAALPEEEPAAEGPEGAEVEPGLRSVLSCVLTDSIEPAIRDLLLAAEHEPAQPPAATPAARTREADEPGYRALFARLATSLPRSAAAAERTRRETDRLYRDLVASTRTDRLEATGELRFHRLDLVERLLEDARGALPSDPGSAEELASLAAAIAGRLADADESSEGRARAACWIAHARRIAGDLAGAERALSGATLYAAGYSDEQAELCRAVALLRWEQGRMEEARAMLERAEELWAGEEAPHEQGACQVLAALLSIEEGRARDAVRPLRDALPLLIDPWLTVYGRLALALGLAEKGQAKRAREQRGESGRSAPLAPPAAHLFALHLEARIALSLGEHAAASAMLEDLRREAIERRWLPEAALATLNLARLDIERGSEPEAAAERLAELEAIFTGSEPLDGLVAALREFPQQIAAGESLAEFTPSLAATMLRLLRLRGVRGGALPFA